jgi:hypothetical protein
VYITAINETPDTKHILFEYGYMTFDGEKYDAMNGEIIFEAHSRLELKPFEATHDTSKGFYYMIAKNNENFQPAVSLRGYYREVVFPDANIEVVKSEMKDGNMILILRSNVFIPVVNIQLSDDTVKMSDNYFQLLPNIDKKIEIYGSVENPVIDSVIFTKKEFKE